MFKSICLFALIVSAGQAFASAEIATSVEQTEGSAMILSSEGNLGLISSCISTNLKNPVSACRERAAVSDSKFNELVVREVARKSMRIQVAGAFDADATIRRELFIKDCMRNSKNYQIPSNPLSDVQIRLWCVDSIDNLISAQ